MRDQIAYVLMVFFLLLPRMIKADFLGGVIEWFVGIMCTMPILNLLPFCSDDTMEVGPDGGSISLEDIATFTFSPESFDEAIDATVTTSQDLNVDTVFQNTASVFRPDKRLYYEINILLDAPPKLPDVVGRVNVPDDLLAELNGNSAIEVFFLFETASADQGPLPVFELVENSAYNSSDKSISFVLPASAFSETGDGQYEAVITLAATPGGSGLFRRLEEIHGVCKGPSVRCPLATGCTVTSPFSYARVHPVYGTVKPHTGTDFKANIGTPVLAAATGIIERAQSMEGYGNTIILRHQDKSATLYAHLDSISVSVGTAVDVGTQIALSGKTGVATGPHLHFELIPNGEIIKSKDRIDPYPCIGQVTSGSITCGDNGSAADDAFTVKLNNVVLGTTTIGGQNTLSVNNLIPGTFPMILEITTAPDDIGTWFLQLNDGIVFTDGSSFKEGYDVEGASYSFEVVIPDTAGGGPADAWTQALVDCSTDSVCNYGRLVGGMQASHTAAALHKQYITNDLQNHFCFAASEHMVPVAVIKALASRETNMGSYLGNVAGCPAGYGDAPGCHGFGLLQVDNQFHTPVGGPLSLEHILQGVAIFKDYRAAVVSKHPDWAPKYHLKGAAVAYNSGIDNVGTIANMDKGTTNNDYGSDVMARAMWFHLNSDNCST